MKFDNLKNYRHWEQSKQRGELAKIGNKITEEPPQIKIMTGLETWFAFPGSSPVKPPPKHKMLVVIWLCIFPLLVVINWLLAPYVGHWSPIARIFVMTLFTIPIMTYIAMPMMRSLFSAWLYPEVKDR